MRPANLALKFLLELGAFAALAYGGLRLFPGLVNSIVAAVVLPVVAILVWGRWCAPRSAHRLAAPARIPLELGVFAVAAACLFLAGAPVLGTVFAVLVVVNAGLLTLFGQWEA